MASNLRGALCAASLAFVSTTPVSAQSAPGAASAATVWSLRAGLNVAALGCRGPDAAAIVAGYNRMLTDRRTELATVYRDVGLQYRSNAAMDEAMTRLYNEFAWPATQATLCEHAAGVLDMVATAPEPLAVLADRALAQLEGRRTPDPMQLAQVAAASIPVLIDTREADDRAETPDDQEYTPEE